MKNRHILYLTYDGLTDPLGQSQVLPYLMGLSKKGWEISVISFEKPERFKALNPMIHEQCKNSGIYWIPKVYHKQPPVFSTLVDLNILAKTVKNTVEKEKPFLIHCRSYLPMLAAMPYQKQEVKVLFDIRGFWADERMEGGIWDLDNPVYKRIYRFFKKKEVAFFNNSDAIISLTQAALPIIRKSNPKASISVIPTATDLELFNPENIHPAEKEKLKSRLGIKKQFVLGYAGSLGTWYLVDEMMVFYKRLLKKIPEAVFLIVSRDSAAEVFALARKYQLPEKQIAVCKADRTEMPLYLSMMDVSVMLIKPSFSKKASSPTKLGELMAMNVPVICNANVGDVEEIVNKYRAGIVLNNLSNHEFDKAIDTIDNENNWVDLDLMSCGAKEYYCLKKGVEKYDETYKSLSS